MTTCVYTNYIPNTFQRAVEYTVGSITQYSSENARSKLVMAPRGLGVTTYIFHRTIEAAINGLKVCVISPSHFQSNFLRKNILKFNNLSDVTKNISFSTIVPRGIRCDLIICDNLEYNRYIKVPEIFYFVKYTEIYTTTTNNAERINDIYEYACSGDFLITKFLQ